MAAKRSKVQASAIRRGQVLEGSEFEGEEVVRSCFVVIQFANGVDERHEMTDMLLVIEEDEND